MYNIRVKQTDEQTREKELSVRSVGVFCKSTKEDSELSGLMKEFVAGEDLNKCLQRAYTSDFP